LTQVDPLEKLEQIRAQIAALVDQYAEIAYQARPFQPGSTPVPPAGKVLGAPELRNLVDASLDGWLTTGRFNEAFEKRLAALLGVPYALTVNSGSSANLLAFAALTSPRLGDRAVRAGDEVIGVAAGFPTTVNPILQAGAVPVLVDVTLPTYNVDPDKLEAALSPRTRAVMLAHTLGNPFNLQAVGDFCKRHGLWLIEDCCDALGSTYQGRPVGTFGDIGTLSFYPAHHITMGEGGAVFTRNAELRKILESFRDWGRDCFCPPGHDNTCRNRFGWKLGDLPQGYDHKYIYSHLGYNLKITDMQAACGLAQLDRLEGFVEARKRNFATLRRALEPCQDQLVLPEATPGADPSWFGFLLSLRPGCRKTRLDLLNHLNELKIGTRLLFAGNLTRQPYMAGRNFRVAGSLETTDFIMENTFWIGVYPGLTEEMLAFSANAIRGFLEA
jgi:CDP-6-deoxy-D-xylo-4-hexulose-3-dehydrase